MSDGPDHDRSWTVAPGPGGVRRLRGDRHRRDRRRRRRPRGPADHAADPGSGRRGLPVPAFVAAKLAAGRRSRRRRRHQQEGGLGRTDRDQARAGSRSKTGPLEDTCIDGTPDACKRWAMDGFYAAIKKAKAGKLGRALRVSWYGDSVVATDAIPGRLRTRMQTEYGDGGPGFVWVAAPHRFVGHEAITRTNSGDWQPHAISTIQVPDGLYGPGGSSAETRDGAATIKITGGGGHDARRAVLSRAAARRRRDDQRRRHRRDAHRDRRRREDRGVGDRHRDRAGADVEGRDVGRARPHVRARAREPDRRRRRQPRHRQREREELRQPRRRALDDRARAPRRRSRDRDDRRERGAVARADGPGHQGVRRELRAPARADQGGAPGRRRVPRDLAHGSGGGQGRRVPISPR